MEINKDNNNKKRLGRGLGTLLGGGAAEDLGQQPNPAAGVVTKKTDSAVASGAVSVATTQAGTMAGLDTQARVWNMSVDKLVPGLYQPRKNFEKTSLQELADSIKQNGILQPIIARKREAGGFEIIAGERRWRAAQLAGLHEVPVIVKAMGDKDALQLAIIENVQREDLDPIEEADGYQRLMDEFALTQNEVAEKVGKERSTVANALRLLGLPNEVKQMLTDKHISAGHAKVLSGLQDARLQVEMAKKIASKNLSVRALEQEIKNRKNEMTRVVEEGKNKTTLSAQLAKELAEKIQKKLGTKVDIVYQAGRGHLTIQFYTDEQLNNISEKFDI